MVLLTDKGDESDIPGGRIQKISRHLNDTVEEERGGRRLGRI